MAELLVKAIDVTHKNSVKDKAGCYKRGDVVVVMPDAHEWGNEERLPKFMMIKIPDLSVKDARKYIKSEIDDTDPENKIIITRRLFGVMIDDTPPAIKDSLNNDGEVTVNWSQIKSYVKNKVTEVVE
jgi:hypothetical protein